MSGKLPVLLFEPQSLLRQTVALTCSSLRIGPIHQAATLQFASCTVVQRPFAAVIISIDDIDSESTRVQAVELIQRLRAGETVSPASVHVLVTASTCDRQALQGLHALGVHKILLKPFKARHLIDALMGIANSAASGAPDDQARPMMQALAINSSSNARETVPGTE